MSARKDRDQLIPDRRIEAAIYSTAPEHDSMQAVRELIEEAYRRGMSAGQMKARLGGLQTEKGCW